MFGLEAVAVEHVESELLGVRVVDCPDSWCLEARSGLKGMLTVIPARPREQVDIHVSLGLCLINGYQY